MTMIAMLPEEYPHEDFLEELDWALEGMGFFTQKNTFHIEGDCLDDVDTMLKLYEWDDAYEEHLTYLEELEERRCEEQELAYEHLPHFEMMYPARDRRFNWHFNADYRRDISSQKKDVSWKRSRKVPKQWMFSQDEEVRRARGRARRMHKRLKQELAAFDVVPFEALD
ncbi:MAG: hypothetical protein KDD60_06790 [Bdellovibrionales bacterium]|nr:hypothetical protein [Bdellovibrionales bacterium]